MKKNVDQKIFITMFKLLHACKETFFLESKPEGEVRPDQIIFVEWNQRVMQLMFLLHFQFDS